MQRSNKSKRLDTKAHAATQYSQGVVGASVSSAKKRFSKRGLGLVVLFCMPVLIFIAVIAIFGSVVAANNQCKAQKTSPIYNEAQASMRQLFRDDLKQTVVKIEKQKNFEKDANCLYPLVVFYIREGDADNAQKYFDKMQQAYNDKVGFAKVYELPGKNTLGDMAPAVANLRVRKELNAKPQLPSVY